MVTPTGGTRPTPMTLEEARVLLAKQAARLAKARNARKAKLQEARAMVAQADAKAARK